MSSKINWLVTNTSPGSFVLQQWLTENGISYSLAQKYAKNGWLKKLSAGVYYRPGPNDEVQPSWVDAIQAMEVQLHHSVHLAGLSSLTHQGLSHYLKLGEEKIWVGVENKQSLPKWFREFPHQHWFYSTTKSLKLDSFKDLKILKIKGKELKASSTELAAYEVVEAINKQISFEHAAELFQGLVNLSPRKVQSILERSNAVQTNRVFLFLSHHHEHAWAQHLDETKIELGSGKRQVKKGGRLDERYQITVPESLSGKRKIQNDG
ncbi:MAG: type IV toxin-antitoxin system AbiEi family antitoxin [Idiomarina sp.]|jgi:hypothetical protein|nr:type IV toxin-antitoxin system AbiEi family antitoxin [Idiomarina sp.]